MDCEWSCTARENYFSAPRVGYVCVFVRRGEVMKFAGKSLGFEEFEKHAGLFIVRGKFEG